MFMQRLVLSNPERTRPGASLIVPCPEPYGHGSCVRPSAWPDSRLIDNRAYQLKMTPSDARLRPLSVPARLIRGVPQVGGIRVELPKIGGTPTP